MPVPPSEGPRGVAPIPQPAYGVQPKQRNYWPALGLFAALLILLLGGLLASGLLRAQEAPAPALQVRRDAPAPAIQRGGEVVTMPAEIRDWLEHLRRIEERKNELHAQQVARMQVFSSQLQALGAAAGLLSDSGDDEAATEPHQPVKEQVTYLQGPWRDLVRDFESVPPPGECQPLADEYFQALSEVPAMMGDVEGILNSINSGDMNQLQASAQAALEKSYASQGKSGKSIDAHFAAADTILGQLCQRYDTAKWFSISPDLGGGLLTRPGF